MSWGQDLTLIRGPSLHQGPHRTCNRVTVEGQVQFTLPGRGLLEVVTYAQSLEGPVVRLEEGGDMG